MYYLCNSDKIGESQAAKLGGARVELRSDEFPPVNRYYERG
jgi:hypothetical protein